MGPDCEMSLHRLNAGIPTEPLGVHELVSHVVLDLNYDKMTCRTYHTDVVFRHSVSFGVVLGYLVE